MWRIELKEHQNLYFTSDTHYQHTNICRGISRWENSADKTRPFDTLEKMNDTIINNINGEVGQDDILVHLGDIAFGGFEYIHQFLDRVVCKNIYLILGNHDHHIDRNRDGIRGRFVKVSRSETLEVDFPSGYKYTCEIQHYPMVSWDGMSKGRHHLFGHVHLPPHKKLMPGKAIDVGMDGNKYVPYNIKEIISILDKQPIKTSKIEEDHHETNKGR